MNPAKKYFALLWVFLVQQCLGTQSKDTQMNISNRLLNLNLNLQHSSEESSSSTVLAIDPIRSFLLWTIIEALALGFITTAALGSLHSSHMNKYPPNLHPVPYQPHVDYYSDLHITRQELKPSEESFPIITDLLWPSETELYLSLVDDNVAESSVPCLVNITKAAYVNPP